MKGFSSRVGIGVRTRVSGRIGVSTRASGSVGLVAVLGYGSVGVWQCWGMAVLGLELRLARGLVPGLVLGGVGLVPGFFGCKTNKRVPLVQNK